MADYQRIKNHDYYLLQAANVVNRLGDSVDAIALSWLIYSLSQSPSITAIHFAVNTLPNVLLQPLMGAWITDKRKKLSWFSLILQERGLSVF